MEKIFTSRWFHAMAVVILTAGILLIYSNTFTSGFQFDDVPNILEKYSIRNIANLSDIVNDTRPVTNLTFAVNYALHGFNVPGYHIVNTAIHIINSILVYFLLLNTISMVSDDESWARKIAFFSSLLFAVHPIQTQAVTYIVQRMESLASLFYLLALLAFIKASKASTTVKRVLLYGAVAVSYALGFYSKEIAITMPAIILLYDLYFVSREDSSGVARRWPLYALLAGLLVYFSVSTIVPLGGFNDLSAESSGLSSRVEMTGPAAAGPQARETALPSAGFGVQVISPREYLYTQFNVIVYYLTLLLVPANQNIDYDFPVSKGLFEVPTVLEGTVLNIPIPPPAVSLLVLVLILGLSAYLFISSRARAGGWLVSFFILWFFIILSPTSSFIPIIDVIFEHRLYLASVGFFVIFTLCVDMLFRYLLKLREPGKNI